MAYIEFGNTWWGKKWLDALLGTDYSNRLPRGKRYARNGSVKKVDVSGLIIHADVKGSRLYPYKVKISLPEFSSQERQDIIDAITGNPLFLSQLLTRRLPPALFDVFEQKNIPLFPKTWNDLSADCSCPDWAECCKHIAAIIYLIANEVDKNPFLLFEMHGFDIFDALTQQGFSAEKHVAVCIPSPQQFIQDKAPWKGAKTKLVTREERDVLLGEIDFTKIPEMNDKILALLADKPLFYLTKDFKVVFGKALKSLGRHSSKEIKSYKEILEKQRDETGTFFDAATINISPDLGLTSLTLSLSDDHVLSSKKEDIYELFFMLYAIPRKEIHSHHERAITLSLLVHFALKLIQHGAIIPEILTTQRGYRIRWTPALISPPVQEIFDIICSLSPDNLVETPFLSKSEQVRTVLSAIIDRYISLFAISIRTLPQDDVIGLFFKRETLQKSKKFGDGEIAENITLWLNRFHMAQKDYVPLVRVDETKNGFALELLVESRKDELSPPIPLKKILTLKKYETVKYDILKDVTVLADYLPEINDFLASKGERKPEFSWQEFEAVLFHQLPVLKLLNISIMMPKGLAELVRPKISAKVKKATSETTKSYLSLDKMLDFQWQVALGDQLVSRQDFEKLVRGLKGIVKIKDQFVYFDEKEITKLLKDLESEPRLTSKDILKTVLSEEYEGAPLHFDKQVRSIMKDMMESDPLPVPDALQATLRDYQHRGYEWLSKNARIGFGSLIADDMGLGKTVQIIAFLLQMLEEGKLENAPALVVVPTSLLTNWQREMEKFAPDLRAHVYHGTSRNFRTKNIDVFLTTYGLLRRDETKFSKLKWAAVIIDEAQAIKNHGTAQTKSVKKIKSDLRIAMTGTPVENRLTEYWSILDFLNKGYLKGVKAFKSDFAMPIEVDRDQNKLDLFRKITAPFILRRLKSDKSIIKDLPDKIELDQYCGLAKDQAALYQSTMDQIMKQIEGAEDIERRGLVFKLITALKQICNHPSHFLKKGTVNPEHSGKTALLLELLRTMADNEEKLLIFTQYTQMGHLLETLIEDAFGQKPLFLYGGLSRKKRDEMVDDFQNKSYVKTMILSLKAGGTGLNLTAAQNVVHFDLWWNPAVEAQATDRAYRIGQTKNVMVHRLITRGTFEEKINDMLKDKRELADLSIASGEKWIGEYSNKDLRDIFTVS